MSSHPTRANDDDCIFLFLHGKLQMTMTMIVFFFSFVQFLFELFKQVQTSFHTVVWSRQLSMNNEMRIIHEDEIVYTFSFACIQINYLLSLAAPVHVIRTIKLGMKVNLNTLIERTTVSSSMQMMPQFHHLLTIRASFSQGC